MFIKSERLAGIAVAIPMMVILLTLFGCENRHKDMPVAFFLPVDASYERGNFGLWERSADDFAITDGNGSTIPIGSWTNVRSSGGVLFCENEDGEMRHFALNARNGGVWVEDQGFYDGRAVVTSFGDASLIPQRDVRTGKLGYLNRQMLWMIPSKYQVPFESGGEWDLCFVNGTAFPELMTEHGEKSCMLTEDGTEAILRIQGGEPSERRFRDGFCLFRKTNYTENPETGRYQNIVRCNFLSEDNIVLVKDSQYDDARDFSEGYAAVHTNAGWGYIDTSGREVLSCAYNGAGDFHNGRAMVSTKAEGLFFIDPQGNQLTEPMEDYTYNGQEGGGLYCVTVPKKGTQLMDAQGKVVTNRQFHDYAWNEEDSVWYASETEYYDCDWLISPSGIALHADYGFQVSGDRCVARKKGKDVLYDLTTGRKLFSALFIDGFREGLSCAGNTRFGYIDRDGNWVIPPVLQGQSTPYIGLRGEPFYNGLALANYNGQNVMLYNPLIYTEGWVADEFDRAVSLGLGNATMDERELTADGLLALVEDFQAFVRGHLEDGVFSVVPTFRAKEDYLTSEHGGQITREELAVCLSRLAEDLGENTRNYAGFYADQDAIAYSSEVNYTASLALFDVENNIFDPQGSVSQRDAAILFLRFTETML